MLKFIYILVISIAFTNTFQGAPVNFYLKYILSIFWIMIFVLDLITHGFLKKKLSFALKKFCLPYIFILFWSLACLLIYNQFKPEFLSRMIGSILYLLITYTTVVAAVHFFGKKTIELSLYAMVLSTSLNLIITINRFGISNFIQYLKTFLFTTNYIRGSALYSISAFLEVQDITMAAGIYIIYYLFFYDRKLKNRKKNLILAIFCFISGFKRAGLVALGVTCIVYFFILKKETLLKNKTRFCYIVFIIMSFVYLAIIKLDLIKIWANYLSVTMNGRDAIYGVLSSYYDLVPWFIGRGYSYVDKVMYETTTFVSHSIVGKMYSELGFIPYILWTYHFIKNTTFGFQNRYGNRNASIYLTCCIYVFSTFFFENTLTLYCIQYSFLLISLASDITGRLHE